ncbi:MAG: HAD family hydrolase [Chloroflexi bacterium]|nr:HAD family hydrolase [Chloroflexota bacterium]
MIEVVIPGRPTLYLRHLVLDVNGTLALDGILLPGVAERLRTLRDALDLHILTADTHGTQERIDQELQITGKRVTTDSPGAEQKADYVRQLGVEGVAAIGNGANDTLMLREAALSIAVLGPEGLAGATLREADVVVARIVDALDLLLFPRRLSATLRP